MPSDQNVVTKEAEKRLKYKSLEIEISRMWGVKAQVVPIVIGALGFVPQNLCKNWLNFQVIQRTGKCKKLLYLAQLTFCAKYCRGTGSP